MYILERKRHRYEITEATVIMQTEGMENMAPSFKPSCRRGTYTELFGR